MDKSTAQVNAEFKAMQEELGCYGCKYADKRVLGKRPCCTSIAPRSWDKDGKCLQRREG